MKIKLLYEFFLKSYWTPAGFIVIVKSLTNGKLLLLDNECAGLLSIPFIIYSFKLLDKVLLLIIVLIPVDRELIKLL